MTDLAPIKFPTDNLEALEDASAYAKEYINAVNCRHVSPDAASLERMSGFDSPMPDHPNGARATLRLLHDLGSPATVSTTAGRFFGLAVGSTLPASLGARVLTSAWDQIVLNDTTSPVGVKLEEVARGWLLDILKLPVQCSVGFTTGATMANFTCLAGARQSILGNLNWDVSAKGLYNAPRIRIVASQQIHVTVLKALSLLGFGVDNIEYIPCDLQGRALAEYLPDIDGNTIVSSGPQGSLGMATGERWQHCRDSSPLRYLDCYCERVLSGVIPMGLHSGLWSPALFIETVSTLYLSETVQMPGFRTFGLVIRKTKADFLLTTQKQTFG
jgi:hypothetical protein